MLFFAVILKKFRIFLQFSKKNTLFFGETYYNIFNFLFNLIESLGDI